MMHILEVIMGIRTNFSREHYIVKFESLFGYKCRNIVLPFYFLQWIWKRMIHKYSNVCVIISTITRDNIYANYLSMFWQILNLHFTSRFIPIRCYHVNNCSSHYWAISRYKPTFKVRGRSRLLLASINMHWKIL